MVYEVSDHIDFCHLGTDAVLVHAFLKHSTCKEWNAFGLA